MSIHKTILTSLVALALVVAPIAIAKDNDISQGRFDTDNDTEDNINNDWDIHQEIEEDSAASAANCQLIVAVEIALSSLADSSALAIVSDDDDVAITDFPGDLTDDEEQLDAETSDSTCDTSVGPVVIALATSAGWGSASPHGSLSDVAGALSGGYNGGNGGNGNGYRRGPGNSIDQGRFNTDVFLEDNIINEYDADQDIDDDDGNSALSLSNCQAIIGARLSIMAVATDMAEARIDDSDTVVITAADPLARASNVDFNISNPDRDRTQSVFLNNNHKATSKCKQAIAGVSIVIAPESRLG